MNLWYLVNTLIAQPTWPIPDDQWGAVIAQLWNDHGWLGALGAVLMGLVQAYQTERVQGLVARLGLPHWMRWGEIGGIGKALLVMIFGTAGMMLALAASGMAWPAALAGAVKVVVFGAGLNAFKDAFRSPPPTLIPEASISRPASIVTSPPRPTKSQ